MVDIVDFKCLKKIFDNDDDILLKKYIESGKNIDIRIIHGKYIHPTDSSGSGMTYHNMCHTCTYKCCDVHYNVCTTCTKVRQIRCINHNCRIDFIHNTLYFIGTLFTSMKKKCIKMLFNLEINVKKYFEENTNRFHPSFWYNCILYNELDIFTMIVQKYFFKKKDTKKIIGIFKTLCSSKQYNIIKYINVILKNNICIPKCTDILNQNFIVDALNEGNNLIVQLLFDNGVCASKINRIKIRHNDTCKCTCVYMNDCKCMCEDYYKSYRYYHGNDCHCGNVNSCDCFSENRCYCDDKHKCYCKINSGKNKNIKYKLISVYNYNDLSYKQTKLLVHNNINYKIHCDKNNYEGYDSTVFNNIFKLR